jgi:hypothetical protein
MSSDTPSTQARARAYSFGIEDVWGSMRAKQRYLQALSIHPQSRSELRMYGVCSGLSIHPQLVHRSSTAEDVWRKPIYIGVFTLSLSIHPQLGECTRTRVHARPEIGFFIRQQKDDG